MRRMSCVIISVILISISTSGCAKRNNFHLHGDLDSQQDVTVEYKKSQEEKNRDHAVKNLGKAILISTPTALTIATGGAAFPLMLLQYIFIRP